MDTVFDPKKLREKKEVAGMRVDGAGNLFLLNGSVSIVEEIFSEWIRQKTSEKRLKDIGRFPLKAEEEKWLDKTWKKSSDNIEFVIPELLKVSHIPLFFSPDFAEAIVPKVSQKICHYFYDLWEPGSEEPGMEFSEDLRKTLFGFSAIFSFI